MKIFIYISLFIFSMIGCIQSFVIKTTNYSGQGFEIYHAESEISPHVTQLKFGKIDPETLTGSSSVGKAEKLYKAVADPKTNIYINPQETDSDGNSVLQEVHKVIQNQNDSKDLKMSDARKGVNEGVNFKSEIDGIETSKGQIHKFEGSPYTVLSSQAKGENYNIGGNTTFNSNIKLWIPVTDDKGKIKEGEFKQVGFNWYEFDEHKNEATKKIENPDANNQNKPKNLFTAALFNYIFDENKDFYKDFLSINPVDIAVDGNKTQMKNFNNFQRLAYANILSYLGVQDAFDKNNKEQEFKFLDNSMPGVQHYGDSGYRPILSWKDAWSLGPFYGLFVYPIGKLFALLVSSMPLMQGWEVLLSIVIIVVLSRLLTFLLSFKSTMQQTKMQELQAKKAIIDAKYAPYKGNKQMENRKRQETAELYKKAGINPLGALGTVFVTMPIFLTLLRVIGAIQQVKSTIWLGINFSATSYQELLSGSWQYLPLLILAAATQLFAQLYPRLLTRKRDKHQINVYQKAAMKKNNKTQNIMMGVMVFMALIFSAGIQIYWIIGGIWRIFEVYLTHKLIHRKRKPKVKNYVLA